MRQARVWIGVCIVVLSGVLVTMLLGREAVGIGWGAMIGKVRGGYSIADRLAEFGAAARARLAPHFDAAGVGFPPAETRWLAFKDVRVLEVYARGAAAPFRRVRSYPILGASGRPGPKLREGDRQVPEGVYRVVLLNPNSLYHVSLRLDYPNAFDRRMAEAEGRSNLGGDIMIHGKSGSVGCLAMGDEAAEDLFTLAAAIGCDRVTVVISPTDFRLGTAPERGTDQPSWTQDLYADLRRFLSECPR